MLPRPNRLASAPFDRAFHNAQTLRHPFLALRLHRRNDEKPLRAAFVVPKKQGKATLRNRTRRRIRERFRLGQTHENPAFSGCDLIFLSTPQTATATNAQLDEALANLLTRAAKKDTNNPTLKHRAEGHKTHEWVSTEAQRDDFRSALQGAYAPQPGALAPGSAKSLPAQIALFLIGFYQRFISPFTPPSCRFYPTCSCYTHAAIERFGLARGVVMGVVRLGRCHPWHPGGDDPLPETWESWKRPVWWRTLTKFRGAKMESALVLKSRSRF